MLAPPNVPPPVAPTFPPADRLDPKPYDPEPPPPIYIEPIEEEMPLVLGLEPEMPK